MIYRCANCHRIMRVTGIGEDVTVIGADETETTGFCWDCISYKSANPMHLPNERKTETSATLRFEKDAYIIKKENKMEMKDTKWEKTLKGNFHEIYIIEDRIKSSIRSAVRSLYPSCYSFSKNGDPIDVGLEQFYDGKFAINIDASFKIDREDVFGEDI